MVIEEVYAMFHLPVKTFKKYLLHPFTQGVAWLQAGSVANRLIAFGTSLVFARVLGPEGYGYYSLVFALAGTIMIAQDLGIGQGVTNLLARKWAEKDQNDIKNLLAYFTKATLVILATAGLAGVVLSPWLGLWFYQDFQLGLLASIVVATGALTLFFPLVQIVLQTVGDMKTLSVLETTNKFFSSLIPILLLLAGLSVLGIVVGQLIAMVVISIIAIIVYKRIRKDFQFPRPTSHGRSPGRRAISNFQLLPSLKEWFTRKLTPGTVSHYFKFGFLIAVSKNMVKLNSTLPLLFLGGALATASGIGYYKIAFAYMSLPVFLLSPVSRLLSTKLPEIEVTHSENAVFRRFWQMTWLGVLAGALMTLGAIIVGPSLIKLFYGNDFSPSIGTMYGLALFPVASALGVGLGPLFRTLNKMKAAIIIQAITLALLIPTSYYLIHTYSIRGLVFVTVFFTLLPNVISLIYFYRISKKQTTN